MSTDANGTGNLPRSIAEYTFDDVYCVPLMSQAPTLDGYVDTEEWKTAVGFDGFSFPDVLDERRIRAYIGATKSHFYVAFISEMPENGIQSNVKVNTSNIIWDDSVEVWFDPTPGEQSGVLQQALTNALGSICYQILPRGNVRPEKVYGWNGHYRVANGFHDGFWHCEIEIPVEYVAPNRATTDGEWAINLARNWKYPWAFGSLTNREYTIVNNIRFSFVESGCAAIQHRHNTDPTTRTVDTTVSIYNPGDTPLTYTTHIFLQRNLMPEVQNEETITVQPGETKEISFFDEDNVSNKFNLYVLVRDEKGQLHYSRYYKWGPPREERWEKSNAEKLPVDFRFAYYPYKNLLRIRADISGLPEETVLQAVNFVIRAKDGDEVMSVRLTAEQFTEQVAEIALELPPLSGDYEIVATVEGEQVTLDPVVKEFDRHVYEWEHLNLGRAERFTRLSPRFASRVKRYTPC